MDPITTGIGAALLAKALPEERRGPIGVWVMTGAALFPDLDLLASTVTGDPLLTFTFHRGYTHSFLGVVTLAPLLALLAHATGKDKNYRRLLGLCALALLWHIFTDVPTTWGTIVFWPFNWTRVAWDWIFIIDLFYTGLLLLPQLVAWTYLRRERAPLRGALLWLALTGTTYWVLTRAALALNAPLSGWTYVLTAAAFAAALTLPALRGWGFRQRRELFCRLGLAAFFLYVGIAAVSHTLALRRVEQQVAAVGLQVERLAALPQPLSPFRWSGMALTEEGVHRNFFHLFEGGTPDFAFTPTDTNQYVERARRVPAAETYLWFARFPVARYRNSGDRHLVTFYDLRFGLPGANNLRFGFPVVLNGNGEVMSAGSPTRR